MFVGGSLHRQVKTVEPQEIEYVLSNPPNREERYVLTLHSECLEPINVAYFGKPFFVYDRLEKELASSMIKEIVKENPFGNRSLSPTGGVLAFPPRANGKASVTDVLRRRSSPSHAVALMSTFQPKQLYGCPSFFGT